MLDLIAALVLNSHMYILHHICSYHSEPTHTLRHLLQCYKLQCLYKVFYFLNFEIDSYYEALAGFEITETHLSLSPELQLAKSKRRNNQPEFNEEIEP